MNPTRNPAINNTNQRTSLCRIDLSLHYPSLHASKQQEQPTHKLRGQYSTYVDSLSHDRLELHDPLGFQLLSDGGCGNAKTRSFRRQRRDVLEYTFHSG